MRTLVIIILISLFSNHSKGQDLFNYQNSLRYAKYLFRNQAYDDALGELNRCLYLDQSKNQDSTLILLMMKSYRFLKRYEDGPKLIRTQFGKHSIPDVIKKEVHNAYLLNHQSMLGLSQLKLRPFNIQFENVKYETIYKILTNDYLGSISSLNSAIAESPQQTSTKKALEFVILEALDQKKKSPILAASLSAIIPGLGKIYAKRTKDAIFSFILTSAAAYQSFRAFNKNGIQSFIGWAYGGVATGLYVGNIYGSVKASKHYSEHINEKYHEKALHIIDLEH